MQFFIFRNMWGNKNKILPRTIQELSQEYHKLEAKGKESGRRTAIDYAFQSHYINRPHNKCVIMMSGKLRFLISN